MNKRTILTTGASLMAAAGLAFPSTPQAEAAILSPTSTASRTTDPAPGETSAKGVVTVGDACAAQVAISAAGALNFSPSAYCRTVRTWLVDQWACTYTSSNVRPSVRDGSIEHYDRLYGPGMRAALERLPGRAVA